MQFPGANVNSFVCSQLRHSSNKLVTSPCYRRSFDRYVKRERKWFMTRDQCSSQYNTTRYCSFHNWMRTFHGISCHKFHLINMSIVLNILIRIPLDRYLNFILLLCRQVGYYFDLQFVQIWRNFGISNRCTDILIQVVRKSWDTEF